MRRAEFCGLRRHGEACTKRYDPVGSPLFMFKPFERYLQPTAVPEHPEPPASLFAFLWHFARQAKALFIALFVVEFFVALTDSAVPWFMGRIVTLVTTIAPERFLAETWPWLVGMALVVLIARPGIVM
jgi:ATP-binding cassette subfamily B multidrug efflux pump